MNMNYYDTFIQSLLIVPPRKLLCRPVSGSRSRFRNRIRVTAASPYKFTQEELLFAVHVQREGISKSELKSRRAAMRKEFFGKSRACLRASTLPKKYGWGLHFDAEGGSPSCRGRAPSTKRS